MSSPILESETRIEETYLYVCVKTIAEQCQDNTYRVGRLDEMSRVHDKFFFKVSMLT